MINLQCLLIFSNGYFRCAYAEERLAVYLAALVCRSNHRTDGWLTCTRLVIHKSLKHFYCSFYWNSDIFILTYCTFCRSKYANDNNRQMHRFNSVPFWNNKRILFSYRLLTFILHKFSLDKITILGKDKISEILASKHWACEYISTEIKERWKLHVPFGKNFITIKYYKLNDSTYIGQICVTWY